MTKGIHDQTFYVCLLKLEIRISRNYWCTLVVLVYQVLTLPNREGNKNKNSNGTHFSASTLNTKKQELGYDMHFITQECFPLKKLYCTATNPLSHINILSFAQKLSKLG